MTTFDNREAAFEAHFALEGELEFKAQARRDRKVGLWAGGLLGLGGEALDNYALSVLRADLKEPGDADVQAKLEADLAGKADAATIRAKLDQLLAESRAEVTKGV